MKLHIINKAGYARVMPLSSNHLQYMPMPPTAEKAESAMGLTLTFYRLRAYTNQHHPLPFLLLPARTDSWVFIFIKQAHLLLIYMLTFFWFFMHSPSSLDPSCLNFKLLRIFSLEETLWMAYSPTMDTFTIVLLFLNQISSQVSYLVPLLLTTQAIKFWLLLSSFY